MSRIWSMMDTGKQSMMNSQKGLQTVSHNIANKNTEGYSRQRVETKANEPTGVGQLRIGNGARVSGVTRVNNQFIERQLESERGVLGENTARAEMLARVEQVYNEQNNKGLNKYMGEFFNSFRELSNSPESVAIRTMVKESADFLAKDFHRVNGQLTKIQEEADFQMGVMVGEINGITREISALNEKIQSVEIDSTVANDERDRRETLIKSLGEKINIKYAESEDGLVTITAGNNAILVSGGSQRDLIVSQSNKEGKNREGGAQIFYKPNDHSTPMNVTSQLRGGALGGLLETRDEFVSGLLKEMDELAYNLSNEVNKAHQVGYDRGHRTGNAFFKPLLEKEGAAAKIQLADEINNDPGRIAAAAAPNAAADNRVANYISSLQFNQVMGDGQITFDDFYNNVVGKVGVSASRANSDLESQKGIVDQLKNIRESISGVSLDEETTKMIEYQKSYDASARLIKTADEMMDTVLNLKPM